MMIKQNLYIALLLSSNLFAITPYDVSSLVSYGKSPVEVSKKFSELALKKITLHQMLNEHFDTQEKAIDLQIQTAFGISALKWKALETKYYSIVNNDPLYKPLAAPFAFSHDPIIKKTQELLKSYGMNPAAVTIIDSTENCPGYVLSTLTYFNKPIHTLYLDISYLQTLTSYEYTAIIKHELMHLWYADPIRLALILTLIHDHEAPSINDYRKNFEMRADVMGTFHETTDIQGLSLWCSKYVSLDTESFSSHPTFSQRITALKTLLAYKTEALKHAI